MQYFILYINTTNPTFLYEFLFIGAGFYSHSWLRVVAVYPMKLFFYAIGFRIRTRGVQPTRAQAGIYVIAPHSSFFDSFVIAYLGGPSIVGRGDNRDAPIIGSTYVIDCYQSINQPINPVMNTRIQTRIRGFYFNHAFYALLLKGYVVMLL